MKLLQRFIAFVLLTVSFSRAKPYWHTLPTQTTRNLNRLCFVDSLTGWVAGDTGTIIKTTNGGQSWVTQNSGTNENIVDLFMLNAEEWKHS